MWRNEDTSMEAFSKSSREEDDEESLKWAAIERLPTYLRIRRSILADQEEGKAREIDVKDLGLLERKNLLERLVKIAEEDNEKFLFKLRDRMNRVGLEFPTTEVRFEHLNVEAEAYVGSRALPTMFNFSINMLEGLLNCVHLLPSRKKPLPILHGVSGTIKPRRMTLLLGPPGSGKTTLLLALAGKLGKDLKRSGRVTYNGLGMDEFVPERTAAYISQYDLHIPELTVRETLAFSARCQGVGPRYEMLVELLRREKAANIMPDSDLDVYMKVLGLEVCADTMVGDQMRRGISGGQRKRLTTGEMLVGPARALFMDEISTGLDSSTTFQIVNSLRQSIHILSGTAVISLLQPAPETYDLFDDIILLSDGHIVYQGPRENVLEFFEYMGFRCPERKGVADFLQEVTSWKDQEQYWTDKDKPYSFVTSKEFSVALQSFHIGQELGDELARPFDKSRGNPASLTTEKYGVSKKELFKACLSRHYLLMKRNSFVYITRMTMFLITAFVTMTLFLRTEMHRDTVEDGGIYMGAMFFTMMVIMFNGYSDLAMTLMKLPVFYKQRDLLFYPAWAYSLPTVIIRIPMTFVEVSIWMAITYYGIGYDPSIGRFCKQFLVLVCISQMANGLFRLIGALGRNMTVANTFGSVALLCCFVLGGFMLSREEMKNWLLWGYWLSPMTYGTNAMAVNEFFGKSWRHVPPNSTESLGVMVLKSRGVFPDASWYWIGVVALFGYFLLFNFLYTLALQLLEPLDKPQAVLSKEALAVKHAMKTGETIELSPIGNNSIGLLKFLWCNNAGVGNEVLENVSANRPMQQGMILPFQPLSITFTEIRYAVDMPQEMKGQGITEDRLELLKGVSGAFRPGVLTALMGVSGAGKTTLLDVLAGRKTGGYIEGNITISGYPKKQETFARISGYCEQTDIHSPHVTVYESLIYSAWLRLSPEVDSPTRKMLLLKRGGEEIYVGPLGYHSSYLIGYFEGISGVSKMKNGYNPATWMLEVTSAAQEAALGINFTDIYKNSEAYRRNKALVKELSIPPPNTRDLYFPTKYSQSFYTQCKACLWKQHLSYWRNPAYSAVRLLFTTLIALATGTLFWGLGSRRQKQQDLFNAMGAMYSAILFIGPQNTSTVQPVVGIERIVFYRERAAGMYSALPYAFGQVGIELPYTLIQTIIYVVISYTMIGFEWTVSKFFWQLFFIYFSYLYFTLYGMMSVAITPNIAVSAVVSTAFNPLWNVFSGFIIPKSRIPIWWRWFYWSCPVSWSLYGMIGSQFDGIEDRLDSGETVDAFTRTYFGYREDFMSVVAIVLVAFSVLFGSVFAFSIKAFNFQKR
ncbi:putative sulfate-transporting ATPase [Rosa chinensis]|uniref:Putative sulfate-transporting ATPase n=1 Tax=Rosa chinensis TaxID=74649 RepID=A0A2P6PY56_ROSCH|nr:putative sulfate-transporting ATPase [Rosa chinensis]